MSANLLRVLSLLALALLPTAAHAVVEAPDHVIYGNVTIFGAQAPFGTVIEARAHPGGESLATYELGRDVRLGQQFALRFRMDTVDPRRAGYGRPGDPVRIFVGAQLAAETSVGADGVAVRLDLDPQNTGTGPSVIVDDVSRFEGHSGPALINFPVRMNTTSALPVEVEWQTANGTATGGVSCQAGVDYVTDDGVATVAPGALQTSLPVLICGDTTIEPDESFTVMLTRVVNGVPARTQITGTLLDDDDVPVVTLADARVAEPSAGTAPLVFRATLSRSASVDVRFSYATQNQEATAGSDFVASSGIATIIAGQTQTTVQVAVLADATIEPPERMRLALSNPEQATLSQAFVLGRIDDPRFDPMLEHDDDTVGGGNGVTALVQPTAIVLSPGNEHLYAASESGDRVLQFDRLAGGALVFVRDYTDASTGFAGATFDGARDLAISADGNFLYVAALAGDAIDVLARNPVSGDLAFVQRQLDAQADPDAVGGVVRGLDGVTALALSPDGSHLYAVGATADSLVVFARDAATGRLRFLEAEVDAVDDVGDAGPAPLALDRPADVVVSPDGAQVYVAARFGNALLTFARDNAPASAQFGRVTFASSHRDGQLGIEGLGGAHAIAIAPGGMHLYVASEADNALVLFDRAGNGGLTRRKQWTKGDASVPGLGGAQAIVISDDGTEVYVAGFGDNSLTGFARATQGIGETVAGDMTPQQTLFDGDGEVQLMAGPVALALSADQRHVYVAANIDNTIVRFHRLSSPNGLFQNGFEGGN